MADQYKEFTDTVDTFREGVRSGAFVIDQELTATGFDGVESTDEGATGDWINVFNSLEDL